MRPLLIDLLHTYIMVMMGTFLLMCVLAATGTFDGWGRRYKRTSTGKTIPEPNLK